MYDYITGKFISKTQNNKGSFAVVEVCGIGYKLEVTTKDYMTLESNLVKLYTELIHREDKMTLCGFLNKDSRDIFNILTSVSGVGTKMDFALLDKFDTPELISFVINNNYKALTEAKGIGPKLAQKIVLELNDKLMNFNLQSNISLKCTPSKNAENLEEAATVLLSLGYTQSEIEQAISIKSEQLSSKMTTEDILKILLQTLSVAKT